MSALDKAVENQDTITIADVKQFIIDVKKKRENWLRIAERSWREIKKRNDRDKLYGGNNLDIARRWAKFPLWWSCLKIRQPITLARIPIPVLKDTQGDDPFGRTACVVGERLTRGILKTFEAYDEFSTANDDFLVTNFGWGRVFYRKEECLEDEKQRLQMMQPPPMEPVEGQPPPAPQQPIAVGPDGQPVQDYLTDEFGPYLLTGQKVSIDNEEVYFEHGLYSNLYVDPDVTKWNKVTRLAFEYSYSYREFKRKFGEASLDSIATSDLADHKSGKKPIVVFEYHDKFLKEVRWFAENSGDFFQPSEMQTDVGVEDLKEVQEIKEKTPRDNSDLYGLSGFFPCVRPLLFNQASDEFWPIPEYFQVADLIEDIHSIVQRMMLLTKAIRVRFLFDKGVPELKSLIQETGEAGGLGVSNLAQALMNGKGTLATLVAYFPVSEMIEGLENMYKAFQQRTDMFFRVTGLNDLLQGQTDPNADKTLGERQMEGKFALNRIEPFQQKIQQWMKDNFQLLMEMGLKMFSDETLDKYITPQTLEEDDKERYTASLELLRANKRSRFRVDFETDSTIAVNEQWKKQQAIELANTLTKAMESAANVAETQPELAGCELQVLKHMIGEFSDGKLFIDETKESLEGVIQRVSQPKSPEFNKDEADAQLEQRKFVFDQQSKAQDDKLEQQKLELESAKLQSGNQLEQLAMQMKQQVDIAKLQQDDRLAAIQNQIDQFKLNLDVKAETDKLQLQYATLQSDIAQAQEELAVKRNEQLVELRKITNQKEVDDIANLLDARVADFDARLLASQHELEKTKLILDERDKHLAAMQLEHENIRASQAHKIEVLHTGMDVLLKKKEFDAPFEPSDIGMPSRKNSPRKSKVIRDKNNRISEIVHE